MKTINPNVLEEGNEMEVLEEHDDPMNTIVRCNNCGQPTRFGNTRMISGFVGCNNMIGGAIPCFFGDLQPRVIYFQEHDYETYRSGKVYRWRDGAAND